MNTRPLVPEHIRILKAYHPGKSIQEVQQELGLDRVYKLASNENPLGPSPRAAAALRQALEDLNRYPDVRALKLRSALARKFEVHRDSVVCGSGSESIMANILRTFLEDDDELLTSEGTFVGFYVLAQSRGVRLRTVPLKDLHYDLEALAAAIGPRTRIVYLANPNNPTGTIFTRSAFERFMEAVPEHTLIILDEAYIDFVDRLDSYPDSLLYRFDNMITLRTFSKAYGLAGLRVGYGFAHRSLIENLMKVKLPFEPSVPGQAAGVAALKDRDFLRRTVEHNLRCRALFQDAVKEKGLRSAPSQANFVIFELDSVEQAENFALYCLKRGVIVRHLPAFRLPRCIRVSPGLDEDNEAFLQALREF